MINSLNFMGKVSGNQTEKQKNLYYMRYGRTKRFIRFFIIGDIGDNERGAYSCKRICED